MHARSRQPACDARERAASRQPGLEALPAGPCREYLSIEQLAELTPWSPDAIRTKIRRGSFRRGVHYFQPLGRGRQVIFKWSAIVALIEGPGDARQETYLEHSGTDVGAEAPRPLRRPIDVEAATAALERMLD